MTPEEKRERRNARERERYATDPEYREKLLARSRAWNNTEHGKSVVRARKARWSAEHREHLRKKRREWYAAEMQKPENREASLRRAKKGRLKSQGTTAEEVAERYAQQLGVCFICRRRGDLQVDHDHTTGRFRALLCRSCNVGIGLFQDDPDRLMAAAAYVEHHKRKDSKPIGESVPRPETAVAA